MALSPGRQTELHSRTHYFHQENGGMTLIDSAGTLDKLPLELQRMIYGGLKSDQPSIRALRLTSKNLSITAGEYLNFNPYFFATEYCLQRLENIACCPVLQQSIIKMTFFPAWDIGEQPRWVDQYIAKKVHSIPRTRSITQILATFEEAIKKLKKLQEVDLRWGWRTTSPDAIAFKRMDPGFDEQGYDALRSIVFAVLQACCVSPSIQTISLGVPDWFTIQDANETGLLTKAATLRILHLSFVTWDVPRELSNTFTSSRYQVDWDKYHALHSSLRTANSSFEVLSLGRKNWTKKTNCEQFTCTLPMGRALRTLSLDEFGMEASDLFYCLRAHKQTLRHVHVATMTLWYKSLTDGQGWLDVFKMLHEDLRLECLCLERKKAVLIMGSDRDFRNGTLMEYDKDLKRKRVYNIDKAIPIPMIENTVAAALTRAPKQLYVPLSRVIERLVCHKEIDEEFGAKDYGWTQLGWEVLSLGFDYSDYGDSGLYRTTSDDSSHW